MGGSGKPNKAASRCTIWRLWQGIGQQPTTLSRVPAVLSTADSRTNHGDPCPNFTEEDWHSKTFCDRGCVRGRSFKQGNPEAQQARVIHSMLLTTLRTLGCGCVQELQIGKEHFELLGSSPRFEHLGSCGASMVKMHLQVWMVCS